LLLPCPALFQVFGVFRRLGGFEAWIIETLSYCT
jgi:hypothetical protein